MNKIIDQEITYCEAFDVFCLFARQEDALFLDSSSNDREQGRYSFITFNPKEKIIIRSLEDFKYLQEIMHAFERNKRSDLPPFQGGMAGYFAYEMQHLFEKLPEQELDTFQSPFGVVGIYETVISFDHKLKKAWVVGQNTQIVQQILDKINSEKPEIPQFAPIQPLWRPDFEAEQYEENVQKIRDFILAGDIFQANLTQKFTAPMPDGFDPLSFYSNLRKINPAPFSAFLNFENLQIACSSPERFLKLENSEVATHPIKGTRPVQKDPVIDNQIKAELLNSSKDLAENTMIVDLLRNDISRVCIPHSVDVPELCKLYSFATVHHLISKVIGQLSATKDAFDLIEATFPGGSITGAPKVRAMEIITEIEKTQRGPYCGSIGYVDFSGNMDLNIVIRSIQFKDGHAKLQAGGGIVADSEPKQEYQEMFDKAAALFKSFEQVFE